MAKHDAPLTSATAPIWRRRAGDLLRRWREDANLGTGEAAKLMGWTSVKMSRVERGAYRVYEDDVHEMARQYGVTDHVAITEVIAVAANTGDKVWWLPYEKRFHWTVTDSFWLYSQAETITSYHPTLPVAALQEPEYAIKIHKAVSPVRVESEFTADEFVAIRLGMKSIFFNQDRLKSYTAFIPEVALGVRDLFGPEVTKRQLQALLNPPYHPDLQIRVVPTTSVGHTLRGGAINIMTFRHPWEDSVYIESPPVLDPIGGGDRVGAIREWMDPVYQSALPHDESRDVITYYLGKCG